MKLPHKATTILGLKDRIRAAETASEIDALLREGEGYDDASEETRNLWKRKAKQRKAQLAHQSEAGQSADTTE